MLRVGALIVKAREAHKWEARSWGESSIVISLHPVLPLVAGTSLWDEGVESVFERKKHDGPWWSTR